MDYLAARISKMRTHTEEIILPYTQQQLYTLVSEVEKYPEFIPWCTGVRIQEKTSAYILADLLIGFKGISECFTSKVELLPNEIRVDYIKGPFSHLENKWVFTSVDGGTKIDFLIKFEFKSKLLEMLIGGLFEIACQKMVSAFTQRAKELYGK